MEEQRKSRNRKKKRKNTYSGLKAIIGCGVLFMTIIILVLVVNRWSITITLNGSENVVLEYGHEYKEEGVDARLQGSFLFKKGIPIDYTIDKSQDFSILGEVEISYSARFMGLSNHITRTIQVVDTEAPQISLVTVEDSYTFPGEKYKEEGFGAVDNYDGNLTDKVIREEQEGIVIYKVTDSSGNTTEVIRTIYYDDPVAPKLTLEGEEKIILLVGTEYEEPGYRATDNCDGDITEKVTIEGEIDSDSLGEYILTYTIKDDYGNETVAQRTICYVDTEAPQIILNSETDITCNVGTVDIDSGYTAVDNYDGDLTNEVIVTGNIDFNKIGTYTVTYEVTDSSGNTTTVIQTVHVKDSILPELILCGESEMRIPVGGSYTEAGYTASDNYDGDLTSSVQVSGSVNGNRPGTYVITYSVSDSSGNVAEMKRVVICYDDIFPTLTLTGSKNISITAGTSYTEPGYTAMDNYDGNITSSVKVSGNVNVYQPGTYTITYAISDSSGNTTTDTRVVTVNIIRQPDIVKPSEKIIYLTFDDGPSKYTDTLLHVLAKYNVKATFFVVKTNYSDKIADIVSAGHTIALHTFTHDYSIVYSSENAYFEDLKKIQSLVYEKSGILSTMVRFPGGSSNLVSKQYSVGIMTSLAKKLRNMGYQYYDWNVSSGDAGGANTSEQVFQNVIAGVQKQNISIVLQHDTYEYSVNAVEKIIIWGLANGYTFLPLDETSPTAHHKIAN